MAIRDIDPVLARALNDPLMTDPDLAHRTHANAAITIGFDHALPVISYSEETAKRAREEARLQLLEAGAISELPAPQADGALNSFAQVWDAPGVLRSADLPARCIGDESSDLASRMTGDFALAADLPEAAQIMPHGMVQVSASVMEKGCEARLIRYVTPAAIDDVLQYHFNMAERSRLAPRYFKAPEPIIKAVRGSGNLEVHARQGARGLTQVDLVYWQRT